MKFEVFKISDRGGDRNKRRCMLVVERFCHVHTGFHGFCYLLCSLFNALSDSLSFLKMPRNNPKVVEKQLFKQNPKNPPCPNMSKKNAHLPIAFTNKTKHGTWPQFPKCFQRTLFTEQYKRMGVQPKTFHIN